MTQTRSRYSYVAILLHWTIAAMILLNIWLGWRMGVVTGYAQFKLFQLHKSFGLSVLMLTVLRLLWRALHTPPPLPETMSALDRLVAKGAHWLLYFLMLALPLTGWVIVSASLYNLPTVLFSTVPWPHLGFIHDLPMPTRKSITDNLGTVHTLMGWGMLALVALHVGAALKHHFIDRDDVLARMLPFLRKRLSSGS